MFKYLNFKKKKNKGFTILELLIAIFIMSVAILGSLNLIQQSLSYMSFITARLTASYLAQEGIEIVRNIRDTNWKEGGVIDWDDELRVDAGFSEADYNDEKLDESQDLFLKRDSSDGFYNYGAGENTIFTRRILINERDDVDGFTYLEVNVAVSWELKGKQGNIEIIEHLYNWYQ